MPGQRLTASPPPTAGTLTPNPGSLTPDPVTGLATSALSLQDGGDMTLKPHQKNLTPLAGGDPVTVKWFSGPNDSDVVTNAVQPTLPLVTVNVTPAAPTGLVLRGVGFVGGNYADLLDMYPLTGAPTTESSNVHVAFEPTVFYPNVMWAPNYFGAITGTGGTSLHVTPVQHKGYDVLRGTSVQRKFTKLDLKLYYSNRTGAVATSAGATIGSVNAAADAAGTGVVFSALVLGDPDAGIQDVWATYTKDDGQWKSVPLSNCVAPLPAACGASADSRLWAGSPPEAVASARYIVQAATKTGLVTLESNQGAYHLYGFKPPVATTLQISAPSPAVFEPTIPVSVSLKTAGGSPLAGKSVLVAIGGGGNVATTLSDGTVTVAVPVIGVVPSTTIPAQVTASFYGREDALITSTAMALLPSSSAAPVMVNRAPTTLTPATVASPNVGATLTTGSQQPLPQRSVKFTFAGTRGQPAQSVVAITNYAGTAIVGPPANLLPDTYTVTAQFPATGSDTDPTYVASSLVLTTGGYVVPKYEQTVSFGTDLTGNTYTYGDPPISVTASASSGQPVIISTTGGACSVGTTSTTGTVTSATVNIDSGGSCTITASQTSPDYEDASASQTIIIGKAGQTITFAQPASPAVYLSTFGVSASSSSGLTVTITPSGVCTLSGSTVTMTSGTGTCTLTASQSGEDEYLAAANVVRTVKAARPRRRSTSRPRLAPAVRSRQQYVHGQCHGKDGRDLLRVVADDLHGKRHDRDDPAHRFVRDHGGGGGSGRCQLLAGGVGDTDRADQPGPADDHADPGSSG